MAKNKIKTKRAAAKRFKVTGSGKIMRRKAYKGHLTAKKSPNRKKTKKTCRSFTNCI